MVDRLTIIEVPTPGEEELRAVAASVYERGNVDRLGFFEPTLEDAVVDRLVETNPRGIRKALAEAMTRAAADGCRALRPDDVVVPEPPTEDRLPVGPPGFSLDAPMTRSAARGGVHALRVGPFPGPARPRRLPTPAGDQPPPVRPPRNADDDHMDGTKRVYATLAPGRKQASLFSEVDLDSALRRIRTQADPTWAKVALWVDAPPPERGPDLVVCVPVEQFETRRAQAEEVVSRWDATWLVIESMPRQHRETARQSLVDLISMSLLTAAIEGIERTDDEF